MKDYKKKILIVDDEVDHAVLLGFLLAEVGFTTDLAYGGEEALNKLRKADFDFIVSDVKMPNITGPELISKVRNEFSVSPQFVFVSGYSDISEKDLQDLGALKLFKKPVNPEEIAEFILLQSNSKT